MDKYIEEIYNQLENSEFRTLFRRMEETEKELLKTEKKELVEEYTKIHLQIQDVVLRHSYAYGVKVGIEMKNL